MDWLATIFTSSVIGATTSAGIIFWKEKYFDKAGRERRTKALVVNLVYVLDKFVLKCAIDLNEMNQFLRSGGLRDDNNGNYMGKAHSKLPELFLNLEKMNWEDLDISHVSAINNLSLKIVVSQWLIDTIGDILFAEDIVKSYKEEICLIGFETIAITTKLREEYNLHKPNIEESEYIQALISEYNKYKDKGLYDD